MPDHAVLGRTASPSTCQPRTTLSHACGSVKRAVRRAASRRCGASCVVVATYATDDAAGDEARATAVDALPGREHVEHDPVDRRRRRRRSSPACPRGRRRSGSTRGAGRRRTSRRSCGPRRRSPRGARTTTAGPRPRPRAAGEQVSAPDPTPASTTCAPGKMSASPTICGGVLGVHDRGAARHRRARSPTAEAAARGTRCRPWSVTTMPSARPIRSSWATAPLLVWNSLPAASVIVCSRCLGPVSCTRSPGAKGPRRRRAPLGWLGSSTVGHPMRAPTRACHWCTGRFLR